MVEAQIWSNQNRVETAHLLSKQGTHKFMPHDEHVLREVLAPSERNWQNYIESGVIKNTEWQQNRIDFQPYPYPSYTKVLVEMLQQTHIAGVNTFLKELEPSFVAKDLVDSRFVEAALIHQNAFAYFGLSNSLSREEIIIV